MTTPPPALVDSHSHLAFPAFRADQDAVIARARAAGVSACVVVSVGPASAREARDLAQTLPDWAFPTAGLHPTEECVGSRSAFAEVTGLIAEGGFIAVGETGLDGHHECAPLDVQRASLERHLSLAVEQDLPVILHCRDAFGAMAKSLRPWRDSGLRGVLHCFTGNADDAHAMLDAGLHIGVGGIATFKPRDDLRATVREVPDERLLIETDSPWLAPAPMRGRRNEPAFVAHVAAALARDRGQSLERFAAITTDNARNLFGLPQRSAEA